ncbi:S-layer homology domain-containing protein [Paenibacillus sp. FSL R5-0519]|uniref:S-layer homology domain-containing protein n=1 Tax=Paenibacillus sp. FSL R5-0519 TaxID=2921648 RepID=UPI0030DB0B55
MKFKLCSLLIAVVVVSQLSWIKTETALAETSSIFTDYLPEITQITDDAGFTHPGVGLTKELLENVRTKVRAGAQPWTYYFNSMLLDSPEASKAITSSNSSDGKTPSADYFNSQGIQSRFIADGLKAYTQAFMYFMTGDEVYRTNAMMIIRIWEQMDPAKYEYYTDAHIHSGVPLNRMVMAAEILRYTSTQTPSLAWTDQDTTKFTNNLIIPITETLLHNQNHFMNQHNYPILGAMSGYIFTGNKDRYNEAVEWFTVNRTANDQGFNGSLKALFRLVEEEQKPGIKVGEGTAITQPYVQHMEMGRDQAHGGGDLTNAAMISRLIHAQGTKIDPTTGTPSTASDAVDVMEFLNNRILRAADYFWHYMLGYDTVWTPQAYAITGGDPDQVGMGGTIRDTYNVISNAYKGRFATANFWDLYSYYTYVKNEDLSKLAPYYNEAFSKKLPASSNGWRNADAGNDFWLYLPEEAEADAAKFIPQDNSAGTIYEVEDRYTNLTKLDDNKPATKDNDNEDAIQDISNIDNAAVKTMTEGNTSFIRMQAKEKGTKIVYLSSMLYTDATYGLKIRTNGVATLNSMGQTLSLPDTKGEWTYFPVKGAPGDSYEITIYGASNINVDIDHINSAALPVPAFHAGNGDLKLYTYVGASVNIDFSVTDSSTSDTIVYGLQNNPAGSAIDTKMGAFSWKPDESGNFSFVVTATNGQVMTTKRVNIVVLSDRATAIEAITETYDLNQTYEKQSLAQYQTVYQNTVNQIGSASDQDFDQLLQQLRTATENLKLMTPLTPLGSMYWTKVAQWSSWGKDAAGLDIADDGGGSYQLALGSPPHLYHIIDFGPDYKISASRFGFKASIFADRIANSTVYASNDRINWVRITPGVAAYTQEYNTIDVSSEYQQEKYRYIKLEMVQPLPDVLYGVVRNFLEPRGFTIYGTRYDIDNKIQSVSLSADQEINGKVELGEKVNVSITAKEAIKNVKVMIQGIEATIRTTDQVNWTAEAIMNQSVPTGSVQITVDYDQTDGTNGDTIYETTDGTTLFLVDGSKFIPVSELSKVTASAKQWPGSGLSETEVGYLLFDGNISTFGDLNTQSGSYYTIDFGTGATVKLDEVLLMPRDAFPARLNGMIVQGSNDNNHWTPLTKPVSGTIAGKWYKMDKDQIIDQQAYRYLRLYNSSAWSGNISEVEFYGDFDYDSTYLESKVLAPDGYTKGSYYVYEQEIARIRKAIAEPGANKSILLQELLQAGKQLVSKNTIVGEKIAVSEPMVTASTVPWPDKSAGTAQQNGWRAFDGNLSTATDTISNPSWIHIDLGEDNAQSLGIFKFYPRNGNISRINGAILQGSNDGKNYVNLYTISGISKLDWYSGVINDNTAFRYLRYYATSGNANVAELEFYTKAIDKTLLQYVLNQLNALQLENYTEKSVERVIAAKSAAEALTTTSDVTQVRVDEAAVELQTAIEQLVYGDNVPLLKPIGNQVVEADTTLTIVIQTSNDIDDTVFTAEPLPEGATFDSVTRTFSWTPSQTQGGNYNVTFKAEVNGKSTSQTIQITVKGLPTIGEGEIQQLTALQPGTYQVTSTEPSGSKLSYLAANLPEGASIQAETGLFSWTPRQADYGSHFITFYVSNGTFTSEQTVQFNVGLHVLQPSTYTKGSYYLYHNEVERIQTEMDKSNANREQLVNQLAQAENSLVLTSTLQAEKFIVEPQMVTASTVPWPNASAGTEEDNGWRAFDDNLSTATDTISNPAWILVDFGEGTANTIGSFKYYPRSGDATQISRMNGAILQGSNDGTIFTDLYTIDGVSAAQWYVTPIGNDTSFRYLRFYSPNGFANVAELAFYPKPLDETLLELQLEKAKSLDEDKYKPEDFEVLQAVITLVETLKEDTGRTQQQIDSMSDQLGAAIQALVQEATIQNIDSVEVMTSVGIAPTLPSTVNAVYSDQTQKNVSVTWDEVNSDQYNTVGIFNVTGTVHGTSLKAMATVKVLDKGAPSPPHSLHATSISANSLLLNWTAPSDDIELTGYEVFKNGQLEAAVSGKTNSYLFTGLSADTPYTFKVVAIDEAGSRTASSDYEVRTSKVESNYTNPPLENSNTNTESTPSAPKTEYEIAGSQLKVKGIVKEGMLQASLDVGAVIKSIDRSSQDRSDRLDIVLNADDEVNAISVEFPTDAWLKAIESGINTITFQSELATLSFPTDAIEELKQGENLTLSVDKVDLSKLSDFLSSALENMPVRDFNLSLNNQRINTFKTGREVQVRIPYLSAVDTSNKTLVAAYINDKQDLEVLKQSKYDPKTSEMVFNVEHFSKYAVVAKSSTFEDIQTFLWARRGILELAARGIVNGTDNEHFNPQKEVTRAEYLKILVEAFDLVEGEHISTFTDVQADKWYSDAIATAQALNLVTGYPDGTFGLNQAISREEMAVMTSRILKQAGAALPNGNSEKAFSDASQISGFAMDAVQAMNTAGWMKGDTSGRFLPKEQANRAETAVLISRILGLDS